MFLQSSNPQEFLMNMASQNPKLLSLLALMQSSNQSPKDFFMNYAKQQGIDPNQFISQLTGKG